MSDFNLSKLDLSSLERQVTSVIQQRLDRRTTVLASPTLRKDQESYDGMRFKKKYRDIVTLILLCHFSDCFGKWREYLIYEVECYLHKNLLFPELAAMLKGKEISLDIMFNFSKCHTPHELFGNYLSQDQVDRVLDSVHLIVTTNHRVIPETVRRRGYKDKGSLRPESRWLPADDWTLTLKQIKLEERREKYFDLISFYVKKSGDRVLREQLLNKEE